MEHRSVEDIQADITATENSIKNLGGELEGYRNELIQARTAGYPSDLVDQARELGINPDNYGDQETLVKEVAQQLEAKGDTANDTPAS